MLFRSAEGKETIKAITLDGAVLADPYKEERECAFYRPGKGTAIFKMTDGDALILFPNDPHCPGLVYGEETNVKKIIVKVKVVPNIKVKYKKIKYPNKLLN